MKIVIIGDGKVGHKLTTQLSEENYDVVLIDQNEGKLKEAVNELDIFCITGSGADDRMWGCSVDYPPCYGDLPCVPL